MNIYERISNVMTEVRGVEKTSRNEHGRYKYAGHEAVTEAIRASMLKNGIVQTVSTEDLKLHPGGHVSLAVKIRWSCKEQREGEHNWVESTVHALQHAQTSAGNPTAQQIGQALSYACKNFAFKTLMLTGDPDADSDAGQLEAPAKVDDKLQSEADALLMGYGACNSLDEVRAHGEKIAKWGRTNDVPGLREKLVRSAEASKKRIRGQQQ